ncbi:trypsin-7 [Drosophila kikkawai]|uniref:trypsin n=1 Tax=Drosophila kikkawai TaxID=30033 RepID=A0A6P4IVH8_DROKI|nr:trypsin-7 [Drosophila kikkawai]
MSRILVVFLVLGAVCSSSLADPLYRNSEDVQIPQLDGRIVGGQDTNITHYPHQISMRLRGNHRCGGSIYNAHTIISASHCVNTLTTVENLTIVAGSSNIWFPTGPQQELPVREIIMHPKYRSLNNDYDAAILIVDGEFVFNEAVQPIKLAKERPEHDTPVIVTGWGTTSEGGVISDVLQEVSVNVVENTKCKSSYPILLTGRMLCAGVTGGGKDACQGDSGGPLIYNNELLGIVSWGTGCAREKYPGVYCSVPDVFDWIVEASAAYDYVGKVDFL